MNHGMIPLERAVHIAYLEFGLAPPARDVYPEFGASAVLNLTSSAGIETAFAWKSRLYFPATKRPAVSAFCR